MKHVFKISWKDMIQQSQSGLLHFSNLTSCLAICIKTRFNGYPFWTTKWANQARTMKIIHFKSQGLSNQNGHSVSKWLKLAWGSCISLQRCGAWKQPLSFLSKKAEPKKTSDLIWSDVRISQTQKWEHKVCCQIAKEHREDLCLDTRNVVHI